jgi:carbamoyltransferase
MYVLGINELYHDCSAALVGDGQLLAVVEEERLNREKHTPGLCWGGGPPDLSVDWCLKELGLKDSDISAVALSYEMNAYLALKTIVDAVLSNARRMKFRDIWNQRVKGGDHAASVVYGNLYGYFYKRQLYLRKLKARFGKVVHIPHHLAHAASTFRMSGFDQANILIIDGLGEDHSTSLYYGENGQIQGPFENYSQYQSLGMLYKTITFMLRFGYFGDGKTMGLSSYGKFRPEFADILTIGEEGYKVNLEKIRKFSPYARLDSNTPLTQDQKDVAATVQGLLEQAGVALARNLYNRTGCRNLCLAGGVALNCNMNSVLLSQPFVDDLFIQPGAMDMGTAIGAALEVSARMGAPATEPLKNVYYGPQFDREQVRSALQAAGLDAEPMDEDALIRRTAEKVAEGKVVGWFQGRMEFGPRALGNRSIVASPVSRDIRDRVNRIKKRELWRPLAPSVLEEEAGEWFENFYPSPFMTLTFSIRPDKVDRIPAVAHVDNTARIQTVTAEQNPSYYRMIRTFRELTGIPMVMNTSYNRREEPIVCTPAEAVYSYLATDLDCLRIGDFFLEKSA